MAFDPTRIDLTKIDLAQIDTARARELVRDAGYVAIGLGVLTFQQAQVRRRELAARLDTIEARLDDAVEQLEAKLPEPAGTVVGQAHELAKAARAQVRGLLRGAA